MRFKGRHRDKRRITYKAENDGFQADALCDDGYTYQVYLRNDPAPKKYLKQGLSPLHSRTMALFDSLEDDYHHVGMDNLCTTLLHFAEQLTIICERYSATGLQESLGEESHLVFSRKK